MPNYRGNHVKQLTDQIVLLTGAGGGFGRSLTRLLLAEGCALIMADLRRGPAVAAAEAAARELGAPTGRILGFIEADLADPAGAEALYREALRLSPRIDILINNAGIAVYGRIDQVPTGRWEQLMQLNLLAPMRLTSLLLPQLLARRAGHIVNISSCAGLVGTPGLSVYSASKFGLRGFTEALARDLAGSGVDVTGIYPFFARTAILDSERFGVRRQWRMPPWLIDDPDMVMDALVQGMRRRQTHVYPGKIAPRVNLLRRLSG